MTTESQQPVTISQQPVTIWGRVTQQERAALQKIAAEKDRSLSYIVTQIVREWLEKSSEETRL